MVGFNIIYDRGLLLYKSICTPMLLTIYECKFYHIYILSLVVLSLILYVNCLILHKKKTKEIMYKGFLEYVVNSRGSWYLMKGAPHGM